MQSNPSFEKRWAREFIPKNHLTKFRAKPRRERFGLVGAQKEKTQRLFPLSEKIRENRHVAQVAVYQRDAAILKTAAFINLRRLGFAMPRKWLGLEMG
jgi:hypothetical protein